ncbi:MAG: hypothetical protein AAGA77_09795 [Bacteroidota bacterium]
MKYFINKYPTKYETFLMDLAPSENERNIISVGKYNNGGLMLEVDDKGNVLWNKKYTINNQQISFLKCIEASNDEYIIFGRIVISSKRSHHLILRVNRMGQLIWGRKVITSNTRYHIDVVRLQNDYYISGWYNVKSSLDNIEIYRIGTKGNLKQSSILEMGSDDQIIGMIRVGGLLCLFGETNALGGYHGFIMLTSPDLLKGKSNAYILTNAIGGTRDQIRSVVFHETEVNRTVRYLVSGITMKGPTRQTFVTLVNQVEMDLSVEKSICIDVTNGNDALVKVLAHKEFIYVLGRRRDNEYNYVLKLNKDLQLVWAKRFDLDEKETLRDIRINENDEVWISGNVESGKILQNLLIKTDLELTTCKTVDLEKWEIKEVNFKIERTEVKQTAVKVENETVEVRLDEVRLEKDAICPTTTFELRDDQWVQSPYLYLQSAGSMGQDAARGILLQWLLLRNLGKSHLPKGNYANSTTGFNKTDDFVKVFKTKYDIKKQRELNFRRNVPIQIKNADRTWVYKVEDQVYYLFFRDVQKYTTALDKYDPKVNAFQFLQAYGDGLLELEIRDRLAFSVEFELQSLTTAALFDLQVETFSVQGNMPLEEEGISSRSSFDPAHPELRIVEENIRRVKFKVAHMSMFSIKFEMYSDFLMTKLDIGGWEEIGSFALSKDTNEVFKRLEDTSRMTIHGHWQKYNEDAYVNVQNYQDRWNKPMDGLAAGVSKYISLSDTDPRALETIAEEVDGGASMEISYFDLLNVVLLDFHVRRMLGLGHIDTPDGLESEQYIYMAEYITHDQLDYFQYPASKQHLFLSIPTSMQQERMPQTIKTLPVEYGLNVYTGTDQNFQLTDSNGYIPYEPIRYVNIKAELLQDNSIYNSFFDPPTLFSSSEYSTPVFAGVEYKKQGETSWRKPEISHDSLYKDASTSQSFETIPIPFPDDPTKSLLIHKETQEGVAQYAAYSGNIFSRASQIHNSVFTDYTKFTKPNTLLPPHNLNVQLIQEESPVIMTSTNEQSMLAALTGDKTLVRLTFLYTHLHDINYDFGNRVEVFFRDELPRNIVGGISTIQDDTNDHYSIVSTQAVTYNSTGQTLVPNIPGALIDNFKGGVLVVNEKRYVIADIIMTHANGNFPKLKIKKEEDRNSVDLGGGNIVTTIDYMEPDASTGDLFMIIENMSIDQSWGTTNPLGTKIEIDGSQWTTKTESYDDNDGVGNAMNITQETRGIWDTATITPRNTHGVYDIKLDNLQLNHHNQFNTAVGADSVDWYKGIIRIRIGGDTAGTLKRKVLDVVQIVNVASGQRLELIVHDEAYDTLDPDNNIQTGNSIEVNFYPGYRAYLHKDATSGFNSSSILPATGAGSKKTLIGLRTIDSNTQDSQGADYHSSIGIPQILFAQEIIAPQPPRNPSGAKFAGPPDLYGRSAYTLTTTFRAETYGAIYYRADANALLRALYTGDKIEDIKTMLPDVYDDDFYTDRLSDIVGFDYPEGTFTKFPLGNGDYHFPNPNNTENGFITDINGDGIENPSTIVNKIKEALFDTFIPLTEQPLIYAFINGGNYIPIPKKQTIRDKYGKLLNPNDQEYDQAPMAKKLGGHKVRFTDFTLDGEMSKETSYFYMVREMNNRLVVSEPSEILGPIQLINTRAPEAPIVRKVTSQLADPSTGSATAVNFEINAFPASQNIKKIRIYRAINAVDALTPRTMDMVKEFDVAALTAADGILTVFDDFQYNGFLPFGEALFYKIVAFREINYIDFNGDDVEDFVPSKPSKTLLSNIVDTINPSAPQLIETILSSTPTELSGFTLNWNKTAHNARYFLYKMNPVGNWNKVFEVKSNDVTDLEYSFADPLPKVDENNNTIYHRFMVKVENSSGLLNLEENILTI